MIDIGDLPPVIGYGVQPGQITHAFLVMEATLIGHRLNEFQAFQVANGNMVNTISSQSDLSNLLNATIQARSDVDRVTLDNTVVVPAGTLPDGNTIQFNSTTLDLMDRIHGIFLSGAFGTIINQTEPGVPFNKATKARVRSHTGRFNVNRMVPSAVDYMFPAPTYIRSGHMHKRSLANSSPINWANVLQAMQGVNNIKDLVEYFQTVTNSQSVADTVSAIGKGIGAVNSIIDDNTAFGAAAAFVSTLNVSAHCFGDVEYWVYYEATGNQTGAANAVQDMQSIPLKQELVAIQDLALAPFDGLPEAASTVLNFFENVYSYASSDSAGNSPMNNDYQTQLAIVQSDSSIASSTTQGLAVIDGNVDITTNLGLEAPQSGIDLTPGPGGETMTTIADPSGAYDMLVPLGIAGFNYSSSQFTITDPLSEITSGSETVDLSGTTSNVPTLIPPMQGSCNDDDIGSGDADDPDCD
jgi:hypothetical protein